MEKMIQRIKDELVTIDNLILVDRATHGRVGAVGNASRAFFAEKNTVKVAGVIGVEPELIGNIASLILAANCRFKLKTDNYKRLACKVFDRYNQLLPDYHMPPGLHIVLVHVPQLQDILDYPVSRTSEECIEALHKVCPRSHSPSHAVDECREY